MSNTDEIIQKCPLNDHYLTLAKKGIHSVVKMGWGPSAKTRVHNRPFLEGPNWKKSYLT